MGIVWVREDVRREGRKLRKEASWGRKLLGEGTFLGNGVP